MSGKTEIDRAVNNSSEVLNRSLKGLVDAMLQCEVVRRKAILRGEPRKIREAIPCRPSESESPGTERLAAIFNELTGEVLSFADGRDPFGDWIFPRLGRLDLNPDEATIIEATEAIESNRDLPRLICANCEKGMADADRDQWCEACQRSAEEAYHLKMAHLLNIRMMPLFDDNEAYREHLLKHHVDKEIQYHARKHFGHEDFTIRTWDEMMEWLKYEQGIPDRSIRDLSKTRLVELLTTEVPVNKAGLASTSDPVETPIVSGDAESDSGNSPQLKIPGKVIAAAYQLKRDGARVSLAAACEKVGACRKNVERRYPEIVATVKKIAAPCSMPRLGFVDIDSGDVDAIVYDDDR